MDGQDVREAIACLPSVGIFTPMDNDEAVSAFADSVSPHRRQASLAGPAGVYDTQVPRRLQHAQQVLNLMEVLPRLLAEGDDLEDTLTRVCVTLRDSMGCIQTALWPSRSYARELPAVNSGSPSGLSNCITFPVRGASDLFGVIECRCVPQDMPDDATLTLAASFSSTLGRYIERHLATAQGAQASEKEAGVRSADNRMVRRLGTLLNARDDMALIFDREGRILHASESCQAALHGEPLSSVLTLIGNQGDRLLDPKDSEHRADSDDSSPFARILSGETLTEQHADVLTVSTSDGGQCRLKVYGAPIRDEDGAIREGVALIQVIENRRRSEQESGETVQRLQEAMAIAAHDLRAPITSAKGCSQFAIKRLSALVEEMDNRYPTLANKIEGMLAPLQDAEHSIARLGILVDRLLDSARVQAGKLDIRPERTDLAVVVEAIVHEQLMATPTRAIQCALPPKEIAPANADAVRIGQVLRNFLANALRYSPDDSSVQVTLDVGPDEARVTVHDEGVGIAADVQDRIWSRFAQLETLTKKRSDNGLGLGLYICRGIIEAHGGQVGVESASGHGATFWFTLPLINNQH